MLTTNTAVAVLGVVRRTIRDYIQQTDNRLRPLVPSSQKLVEVRLVHEAITRDVNVKSIGQVTPSVEYITYLHPFRTTQPLKLLKENLPVFT